MVFKGWGVTGSFVKVDEDRDEVRMGWRLLVRAFEGTRVACCDCAYECG